MATITQRQLNRTFLERQLLLERTALPAAEVISRLIALQSQAANSPYESLWNRIQGFKPEELDRLYREKVAVRGTWFRSTVHTVTAADYSAFRGIHSELFLQGMESYLPGVDLNGERLEALRVAFASEGELTGAKITSVAAKLFPGQDPELFKAHLFRRAVPLLRHPSGPEGRTRGSRDPWVEVQSYLGETPIGGSAVDLQALIRRYLAAYGPASPADASNFLGIPKLRPIFKAMGLIEHRDEAGRLLYDNPEGVLTDPAVEAPPRLMASFDHSILGHADRTRIIEKEQGRILSGRNAVFKPYILVDGRVTGYWSYGRRGQEEPTVEFSYFSRPTDEQEELLVEEAKSWLECWYGEELTPKITVRDHS